MSRYILGVVAMLISTAALALADEDIWGTWKLVSAFQKDVNTGKVTDAYGGPHPNGFISYGKDHRMMAMTSYDNRIKPARVDQATLEQRDQLFKTFWSYAGTYTLTGNTIEHHVEVAWNETWTGTTVTRDIAFDGTKLVLTTRPLLRYDGSTYVVTLT